MKIKTTYTLFESLNGSINYVEYGKQHKENYFEFTGSLSGGLTIQEMANVMEKAIKVEPFLRNYLNLSV